LKRVRFKVGNHTVISDPSFQKVLTEIYLKDDSVYSWIQKYSDTIKLRGRIAVYAGQLADRQVLLKRLSHGGLLAPVTQDIFLSPDRLLDTIKTTDYLLEHSILTPEIIFVAWQPGKIGIRCESAVEYIPDSIDASEYFFNKDNSLPENSSDIAAGIGNLVHQLHDLDFLHPDLNLMNFLIARGNNILLLDLDKASPPSNKLTRLQKQRNFARLIRSVRKQGNNYSFVESVVDSITSGYGEC